MDIRSLTRSLDSTQTTRIEAPWNFARSLEPLTRFVSSSTCSGNLLGQRTRSHNRVEASDSLLTRSLDPLLDQGARAHLIWINRDISLDLSLGLGLMILPYKRDCWIKAPS